MLNTTIPRLRCPSCRAEFDSQAFAQSTGKVFEISSGELACTGCGNRYPILGGVALLVQDVHSYLVEHVKGISQVVPDSAIPEAFREDYLEAKAGIEIEHIEEDLEAERVIALYLANHYLNTEGEVWWRPAQGSQSGLISSLIREYWDHGPFATIGAWVEELKLKYRVPVEAAVELGCGVGGLSRVLKARVGSYLGIDSSFASIALGRHLALGVPYPRKLAIPNDLLSGPVTREVKIPVPTGFDGSIDLVVGEIESPPLVREYFDLALVLNAMDMMPEPAVIPEVQNELLRAGGFAIQSCPYIWHEVVARELRERLPASIQDSAAAAEWLYVQAGFELTRKIDQLPWLFFKHVRQLEIYSVQIFLAKKGGPHPLV